MKKIFAFILASIMVLSLVPASAFAAFNKCPDTHTKANCDYEFVTSMPSSCTSYGYSVYACTACGTEFLDDFSDELSHTWISTADSKHTNKAATCTEDGYEWVKCAICTRYTEDTVACGGACGDANCMLYKRVIKAEHNPVATGKGEGCETEYKCTVCSTILYYDAEAEKYVASAAHTWNYQEAEILVAPSWNNGVFTKGSALVTCSVEDCPAEKPVEITDMDCKHYVYETVQSYVKATCTAAGQYGVSKCRDCHQYVVDKNGDNAFDGLLVNEDGDATTDLSYAVVKALGHKVPVDALNNKMYISIANCVGTYECVNCKAILTETAHQDLYDIVAGVDVPATCTNDGYDYQYCRACFTSVPVIIEKTGHNNTATITVTKTCVNQGAKYTFCTNANCPIVPTPVRDAKGDQVDAVKAAIGEAYVVSYGTALNGYTYNLKLLKTESVKAIDASAHTLQYKDLNTGLVYDEKPTADCSGYKIIQTICSNGCAASTTELIAQGDHSEYVSKKYANCNEVTYHDISLLGAATQSVALNAFFVREEYACKTCGKTTRYVDTPVQFSMQYEDEEDIAFYHGDIMYVADSAYALQPSPRTATVHATSKGANALNPTCLATGLEIWGCTCCNVGFYKIVAKVQHTQAQFATPVYTGGQAATCDKAGVWASLTCTFCKNTVIWNNYKNEQQVVTSLVIPAHGSTLTKVTPDITTIACKGVSYYECECGKTFTNWDAKTSYNKKADHHDWKVLQAGTPATCDSNGAYEIKFCQNKDCRRYEVNYYVVKEGETVKVTLTSGQRKYENKAYKDTAFNIKNRKSNGDFENKELKIKANGTLSGTMYPVPKLNHKMPLSKTSALVSETRTYGENHSSPSYDAVQCTYCDYEYFTDYVAASGAHMNKNGEVLTTECDNAYVADRICIYCSDEDANNDGVADNVIEPAHDYDTAIVVEPTCVLGGYTYEQCKKCDYRNILSVSAKTDKYHNTEEFTSSENYIANGEKSDYAHAGTKYNATCALCGKTVGSYTPQKITEAGLEIYATADSKDYIPGSSVFVTITLDSLKGVDVWALDFAVRYNKNSLKFVGYTFNTNASEFQTFAANDIKTYSNVITDYDGNVIVGDTVNTESIGVVKIIANANENVTIKGEQILAVLEFKVIATRATNAYVRVYDSNTTVGYYKGYKAVTDEYGYVSNVATYNTVSLKATAIDADKKAVPCIYNTSYNGISVKINGFLDLDGKSGLTMYDAYELYSLIFNNEYDVRADADYDGRVTGLDLAILYSILSGAETVENYVNPQADITPIQPRNN